MQRTVLAGIGLTGLAAVLGCLDAHAAVVEFTPQFVLITPKNFRGTKPKNCAMPQQAFQLGVYEVTNTEYAEFLNAVASKSDPYKLWSPLHEAHFWGGILRLPKASGYSYVVKAGYEYFPATFISWYDALRYVNWLHYGRPVSGVSELGTTEGNSTQGAYDTGAAQPIRNLAAKYFLPSCGEWMTGAFFDPKSDRFTHYVGGDLAPESAPPSNIRRSANFYAGGWANPYPHLARVQDYAGSPSAVGTVSQAGNVMEWTETARGPHRIALGGSVLLPSDTLSSEYQDSEEPHRKLSTFGFRVARQAKLDDPVQFHANSIVSQPGRAADSDENLKPKIGWVRIGRPGNLPDLRNGRGCVANEYEIESNEVTNGQFVDFLNAVVKSDPGSIYTRDMTSGVVGGIDRQGVDGAFTYRAKTMYENRPVAYLSWFALARYANWLHYGKPTGEPGIGTTEGDAIRGAYDTREFDKFGDTRIGSTVKSEFFKRNPGARYYIPSDNEWYKAAYYDPRRLGLSKFWTYPNRSDVPADGNFQKLDSLAEGPPFYLSVPGKFTGAGYFGVLDMGGNLWEWTEDWRSLGGESCWRCNLPTKGMRGGSFNYVETGLNSANIDPGFPSDHYFVYGGRIARAVDGADTSWCLSRTPWMLKERISSVSWRQWTYFFGVVALLALIAAGVKRWRIRPR